MKLIGSYLKSIGLVIFFAFLLMNLLNCGRLLDILAGNKDKDYDLEISVSNTSAETLVVIADVREGHVDDRCAKASDRNIIIVGPHDSGLVRAHNSCTEHADRYGSIKLEKDYWVGKVWIDAAKISIGDKLMLANRDGSVHKEVMVIAAAADIPEATENVYPWLLPSIEQEATAWIVNKSLVVVRIDSMFISTDEWGNHERVLLGFPKDKVAIDYPSLETDDYVFSTIDYYSIMQGFENSIIVGSKNSVTCSSTSCSVEIKAE